MFDFVFVMMSVAGLLGLLAHAARHEDDDGHAVLVRNDAAHSSK